MLHAIAPEALGERDLPRIFPKSSQEPGSWEGSCERSGKICRRYFEHCVNIHINILGRRGKILGRFCVNVLKRDSRECSRKFAVNVHRGRHVKVLGGFCDVSQLCM
jgi:hypothetical protein